MLVYSIAAILLVQTCFTVFPTYSYPHHTISVKDQSDFEKKLSEAESKHELVVVDFWGKDCADCKTTHDKIVEFETKYPKIKFLEVDVDENKAISEKYKLTSIPATVILKDKQQVDSIIGKDVAKLEELIKKHYTS